MSLPARIARYEIVGRLAAGGMAEILLARVTGPSGFERAVVVKRILPHLAAEPSFRSMFLDEARIVARIRHPNVVQVQELGQEDDELYLAMEYLEGESGAALLRRLHLQQRRLPLPLAAYVVAQACGGLHAAHELRGPDGAPLDLVHRDVSPQNVFVTYGGEIKVLDFGIAKAADRTTRTETGTFKGKFEYASPEQCLGQPLDRRSDVFAMGVVLFELTTGRRLFRRENHLLVMRSICAGEIPKLTQVIDGYPAELEAICERALAKDREARFATAGEMRTELLKFAHARGLDPEPDAALARLMRELFADRIASKNEMLGRVRGGLDVGPLPPNESDTEVVVPIVEGTLVATATVESDTAPDARPRRRVALGFAAAFALAAAVAAAGLVWTRAPPTPPLPAASASAAPAPREITVSIVTMPPGARIDVDGQPRGTSPVDVTLAPSTRPSALVARLEGHEPMTQAVVPNMDQKLVLTLVPTASAPPSAAAAATKAGASSKPRPPAKPKPAADPFRRFD